MHDRINALAALIKVTAFEYEHGAQRRGLLLRPPGLLGERDRRCSVRPGVCPERGRLSMHAATDTSLPSVRGTLRPVASSGRGSRHPQRPRGVYPPGSFRVRPQRPGAAIFFYPLWPLSGRGYWDHHPPPGDWVNHGRITKLAAEGHFTPAILGKYPGCLLPPRGWSHDIFTASGRTPWVSSRKRARSASMAQPWSPALWRGGRQRNLARGPRTSGATRWIHLSATIEVDTEALLSGASQDTLYYAGGATRSGRHTVSGSGLCHGTVTLRKFHGIRAKHRGAARYPYRVNLAVLRRVLSKEFHGIRAWHYGAARYPYRVNLAVPRRAGPPEGIPKEFHGIRAWHYGAARYPCRVNLAVPRRAGPPEGIPNCPGAPTS